MGKYQIGKDIGELLSRVRALETMAGDPRGGARVDEAATEYVIRQAPKDDHAAAEQQLPGRRAPPKQACIYTAKGACEPLKIGVGDELCVMPCRDPCPQAVGMTIVDAAGAKICYLPVASGNRRCQRCPRGAHEFVWV